MTVCRSNWLIRQESIHYGVRVSVLQNVMTRNVGRTVVVAYVAIAISGLVVQTVCANWIVSLSAMGVNAVLTNARDCAGSAQWGWFARKESVSVRVLHSATAGNAARMAVTASVGNAHLGWSVLLNGNVWSRLMNRILLQKSRK